MKKKLYEKKRWDWDSKENEWLNKIEIYIKDDSGAYLIVYPNGRQVSYYNVQYYHSIAPTRDELVEYYTGPISINKSLENSGGVFYFPLPNTVPIPLPAPLPIPVPVI